MAVMDNDLGVAYDDGRGPSVDGRLDMPPAFENLTKEQLDVLKGKLEREGQRLTSATFETFDANGMRHYTTIQRICADGQEAIRVFNSNTRNSAHPIQDTYSVSLHDGRILGWRGSQDWKDVELPSGQPSTTAGAVVERIREQEPHQVTVDGDDKAEECEYLF